MPVVSDTSPLLNLAIIGQLSLLHKQFRDIPIPRATLDELRVEEDLPGSRSVREAISSGWIQVETVENQPLVDILQRDLDKGEAEAIALALQVQAEWALLNDREGRHIAKSLGLNVMGVLGILLRAWREGDLPSLQKTLEALQQKAGFYIGEAL